MVGRLTLGQIEQLADPANGLLSEASQASFDEAHRQLNEELAAKLKPAIDRMLPKVVSPVLLITPPRRCPSGSRISSRRGNAVQPRRSTRSRDRASVSPAHRWGCRSAKASARQIR